MPVFYVLSYRSRAITQEDHPFLVSRYGSTREEELSQAVNLSAEQKASFVQMQFLAQSQYFLEKYPEASFDLLLDGSVPIGRRYLDRGEEVIHLIDLVITPERRGRGLGTILMNEILKEATEKKLVVTLYLQKTETCWNFFERMGFRSIADDGVNFLMEWNPEDCPA